MLLTFMIQTRRKLAIRFRVGAVIWFPTPVFGNTIRLNGLYISTHLKKISGFFRLRRATLRPNPISSCGVRPLASRCKRGAPQPKVPVDRIPPRPPD